MVMVEDSGEPRAVRCLTSVSPTLPARNPKQSIDQLPVEIFVDVVLSAAAASDRDRHFEPKWGIARSYYAKLVRFMLVSRRWYDIIVHEPNLWCIIDNFLKPDVWPVILARSKEAPLHVAFIDYYRPAYYADDGVDSRDFVRFIFSLSVLWNTLLLRVFSVDLPNFQSILNRPAPRLRSLALDVMVHPRLARYPLIPVILSDTLGKDLTYLHFGHIIPQWSSTVFSGPAHLHLTYGCGGTVTLGQLFQTLVSSPCIQSLTLDTMDFEDDLEGQDWAPFILPVMHLSLESISEPILRHILVHVRDIPNCELFILRHRRDSSIGFLPSCLNHLLPPLQKLIARTSLDNSTPAFFFFNFCRPGDERLNLQIGSYKQRGLHIEIGIHALPDVQTCIWFQGLFSDPVCKNIPFSITPNAHFNWGKIEHRLLFKGLNIVELVVKTRCSGGVSNPLLYLQRVGSKQGTHPLTYPTLQKLILCVEELPWDELWVTVLAYRRVPNSQEPDSQFQLKIYTKEVNLEVLGRLKKHLGDVNVNVVLYGDKDEDDGWRDCDMRGGW